MKKKLLIIGLISTLMSFNAFSFMITDITGEKFLNIEEISETTVKLYECHRTLDESSNVTIKCNNTPIGNRSYEKEYLIEKAEQLESGHREKFYFDLAVGLGGAIVAGKFIPSHLGGLGDSISKPVRITLSVLAGRATYELSTILTSLLIDLKLESSLENMNDAKNLVITLAPQYKIDDLKTDLSDALLE
jgi:hypothetical protein